MTRVERARAFEAALRAAGRDVDAAYFQGANHVGLFTGAEQRASTIRVVTAFLHARGIE